MPGFDSGVVYGTNVDFSGTSAVSGTAQILTNGQMLIGSTALNAGSTHINVGTITSPLGTLTIGYSSPNITIDLAGGGEGIDSIAVDTTTGAGTNPVVPTAAGLVTISGGQYASGTFGTRVITIVSDAANQLRVEAQISTTNASSLSTKNGICHFNSSDFSVDANGFVSIISGGFAWTDVTSATQTLVAQNGYFTDRGGGVTYTLPASGSLGDVIKIDGKLGLTTIAQNAGQSIRMSGSISTVGVGGSVAGTNVGDCITLRCSTAGASTVWIAENFVGNWTIV